MRGEGFGQEIQGVFHGSRWRKGGEKGAEGQGWNGGGGEGFQGDGSEGCAGNVPGIGLIRVGGGGMVGNKGER